MVTRGMAFHVMHSLNYNVRVVCDVFIIYRMFVLFNVYLKHSQKVKITKWPEFLKLEVYVYVIWIEIFSRCAS